MLQTDGAQPWWALYLGELTATGERIRIWRGDVTAGERGALLARGEAALVAEALVSGVKCEVAFRPLAAPHMTLEAARRLTRPMRRDDPADYALLAGVIVGDFANENTVEAVEVAEAVRAAVAAVGEPLVGVVVDGRLLALAHSSRRTAQACELGIDTLPEARRRGYALAATVAWARLVADAGLAPIYSAFAENAASLALAEAAGYRPFARATQVSHAYNEA